MPLGTWFWMPFFEAKVQHLLLKLKKSEGENHALWCYCEISCLVVCRDPKSFLFCAKQGAETGVEPNETGRGTSFERVFQSTSHPSSKTIFAALFLEVEKSMRVIYTKPKPRHEIAAYSEAKTPDMWPEKYNLGQFKMSAENAKLVRTGSRIHRILYLLESSAKIEDQVGWKKKNFPAGSWNALNASVKAEAERIRRIGILKNWRQISFFAPKAILPNS